MAKDKKKKKKEKKKKKDAGGSDSGNTETFSQTSKGAQISGVSPGITIGNPIDRSGDNLFLGTDYREIYSHAYDITWPEMLHDLEHWTPLPFTHGIEMELIIADDNGDYPDGSEMVFRMKEIVKDAIKIMDQILYEGRDDFVAIPDYIRQKVLARPFGRDDIEKGYCMDIRYQLPDGNQVDIDCFGRDGNVTAITYILELVTPPCCSF